MNTAARLNVFTVTEYDSTDDAGKPAKAKFWTRIGTAFPHKEGPGFNIQLIAFPTNGSLVALPPDDTADEDPEPPPPPQRDMKRRR